MNQARGSTRNTGNRVALAAKSDGTPMTQDEIDTYWLQRVYKPNVPQLTPRAVITGMVLGGIMSVSNLYVGLKTGWGLGVTVTAAVLAFGIFSGLKRVLPALFPRDFTSLENNTMASAASAAGYFTGAGLTSGIPALFMATGIQIPLWQVALWILAVSSLGVMLAVPMRRQRAQLRPRRRALARRRPRPDRARTARTSARNTFGCRVGLMTRSWLNSDSMSSGVLRLPPLRPTFSVGIARNLPAFGTITPPSA